MQATQQHMQDAQAVRACLGLLRQLANSDAIKESIVGASGLELINQAVALPPDISRCRRDHHEAPPRMVARSDPMQT